MRYRVVLTIILALIVSAALIAPMPAHAVQARVTLDCLDDLLSAQSFPSASTFFGASVTSTSDVNLATVEQSGTASDGIYVLSSSCKFKIVGTVQFTADALKVGQLFLNNLSIKNVGTRVGTMTIEYRHQSTATDPTIRQCVSLSADGFFYAGSTFPAGDRFTLTEKVEYFKGSAVEQRYFLGQGLTLQNRTAVNIVADNNNCPYTSGYSINTGGGLSFTVINDAFFNPQNPAQIFNRIPACSGCNASGSTSTSGSRITKTFAVVDLAPGHEVTSIATLRGGIAQQAQETFKPNTSPEVIQSELNRAAQANQLLARVAVADWSSMDLKPGQSVNYILLTSDQGNIVADLHGACPLPLPPDHQAGDPIGPFFDITKVDAAGLRMLVGSSGLPDGQTAPDFHESPGYTGAPIQRWQYGDFNMDGCTDLRGQWRQSDLVIFPGDDRVQIRGNIAVFDNYLSIDVPTPFTAEDSIVTLQ